MKILLVAGFLAGSILFGLSRAQSTNTPSAAAAPDVVQLGHGVNLGNFLEAQKEGGWSGGRLLQEDDFTRIHQAGFTLIRVPIRWSAHVGPAPDYTIDSAFFSRVDWVVAQAEKNNLQAILDYHNDDELMHDPDKYADRFISIWKQVAAHYKDAPPTILLELLNEPFGKLDPEKWNDLLGRTLAVVRGLNPTRSIVVGPGDWNSIRDLPKLALPDYDNHLIVTFHFYDPMKFTHQGASWVKGSDAWLGTKWEGTDAEKKAITDSFVKAAAWGDAHHRPMYLGEFGSYNKGDMDSRARWTSFVVQTANSHNIPWTYWEFCSGFGVYDPVAKQWRQPLLNALLPK